MLKNIGKFLGNNSTTILNILAVGGLVSTVGLAITATPKAMLIIDTLGPDPEPKEVIKATWKVYVPTVVMAFATGCCIVGANSIHQRRNAALAGLYGLSEAWIKEYKNKVIETVGEKSAKKIHDDVIKDRILAKPPIEKEIFTSIKGETLCYDVFSGRYFKSDIETIRQSLNKLSRELLSENEIALNQVWTEYGLPSTTVGDYLCWHVNDGLIEPDFSSQLTEDGRPCLVVDYVTQPRYDYNRY